MLHSPRVMDPSRVCVFLALLLVSAPLYAEPVVTVRNNGRAANRIDIAVVGDGYTAAELPKYSADLQNFVLGMFGQEPFAAYEPYFNVHRVDAISVESGADHPERAEFRNTAFGATYACAGIQRLICVDTSAVYNVVARSLSPDQRDIVIVLVNDPEYGGSGGAIAVSSTHALGVELVLHELGHSFGLLADEYTYGPPSCNASQEPLEPNATMETSRAKIKWGLWIDPATPVPTTAPGPGVPGLHAGAKYCAAGLYRPTYESKMAVLLQPFEQINSEQLTKRMYNFVTPLDDSSPASSDVFAGPNQLVTFRVTPLRPVDHALDVYWEVGGSFAGSSDTITIDTATLTPGDYQVLVAVADRTPLVRNDPGLTLLDSRSWVLHVSQPTPPAVAVVAPNGGETLSGGTPFTIQWSANDPDGLARFDVEVSPDRVNFGAVSGCSALPGTARACTWTAPGPVSGAMWIRVTARDNLGAVGFDVSDASFEIVAAYPATTLAPWTADDVGAVGRPGTATSSSGTFLVAAGGSDVWAAADAFHFVHQPWTGDGDIVARLEGMVTPPDAAFALAGIMFRESLAADARHASMVISSDGKAKFRRRVATGGTTLSNGPGANTTPVPRWLKLTRRGDVFAAYISADAMAWTRVYSQAISMAPTLEVGFLALRNGGSGLSTAQFSGVSLTRLPAGWASDDVGTVGSAGTGTYGNGTFEISAAGADVWSTADAFHFVHRPLTGDGDIVAQVAQLTKPAGAAFAMAGVMIRETLGAGSRHAALVIATDGKAKFRRRLATGGTTLSDGPSAGAVPVPQWLKLSRRGNTFTAYLSLDGASWVQVHVPVTLALPPTVEIGLVALRNGRTGHALATFTGASVLPVGWEAADVGAAGMPGFSDYTGSAFALEGGGTDLWGSADAFHMAYRRWTGDGEIVARLTALRRPAGSTFALGAVTIRETLAPDAPHASLMITTDGKAKFRRRPASGAATLSDGPAAGSTTLPRWIRLVRAGDTFAAYLSIDGSAWQAVHVPQAIAMAPAVYVGVLALRDGGTGPGSAVFEDVVVR